MKKLKSLMMMLLILPCILLSACNGSDNDDKSYNMFYTTASVNIAGEYLQSMGYDEFQTFFSGTDSNTMPRYRITCSIPLESDIYDINGIIQSSTTSDYVNKGAFDVTVNDGLEATLTGQYYQYITNNWSYYDAKLSQLEDKFKAQINPSDGTIKLQDPYANNFINVSYLTTEGILQLSGANEQSTITSTNGTTANTKIKITTGNGNESSIVYLIYENNKLVGLSVTGTVEGMSWTIKCQLTTDEIAFPTFNNEYEDLTIVA